MSENVRAAGIAVFSKTEVDEHIFKSLSYWRTSSGLESVPVCLSEFEKLFGQSWPVSGSLLLSVTLVVLLAETTPVEPISWLSSIYFD